MGVDVDAGIEFQIFDLHLCIYVFKYSLISALRSRRICFQYSSCVLLYSTVYYLRFFSSCHYKFWSTQGVMQEAEKPFVCQQQVI